MGLRKFISMLGRCFTEVMTIRLIDADKLYEKFKNSTSDTQEEKNFNQVGRYLVRHAPTVDVDVADEWVSVSERLPESDEDVLICAIDVNDGEKSILVSSYDVATFGGRILDYKSWSEPYECFSHHHKITHWMPMPGFPKEGDLSEG